MSLVIPLQPVPNQQVSTILNNQSCKINVAQRDNGLFVDLFVNDAPIVLGVIALNLNVIVRSLYLGFIGDIAFVDTQAVLSPMTEAQADSDPVYTGLGDRFILVYFLPSELPPGIN